MRQVRLRPSCSTVYAEGISYAYCGGTFYQPGPSGYAVVAPPIGATITSVPDGATTEAIGGVMYLVQGDTYYRPYHSGSGVVYEVSARPY